jgi:hypothetical protein
MYLFAFIPILAAIWRWWKEKIYNIDINKKECYSVKLFEDTTAFYFL